MARVTDDPPSAARAGGTTLASPWSPIGVAASTTGPRHALAAPLVAGGIAAAAGLALLLGPASGTDLAAQQARAAFASAHPGAAVDFRWFGGVLPAAYSVVAPYVEAVVGVRLTGVLAAVVGAVLLGRLLTRWAVRRPVWAAAWGALALAANLVSGRTAFALGMTLAIGALVAVPARDRPWWRWSGAVALAALTTLTSPVAALFLGLIALAWAVVRRPVVVLGVAAAVVMAALALLFPEPGRMPDTWAVARPVILACCAVVVLGRGLPVRLAAGVYAAGAAVVFAWPGPIGSNVERLALLFTGLVLLATSWLPRVLLVIAVLVAGQWTARVPLHDMQTSHRLAVERAASQRLVQILAAIGSPQGRIEVVPFADHGEASVVAAAWPLARGWERQVDVLRAAPVYSRGLTAGRFRAWLDANDVQLVALGHHAHDWAAAAELKELQNPPPWLQMVHEDPEWTVWQVQGFEPVVPRPAVDVSLMPDRITFSAPAPGVYPVRVHWSRWLTVSAGACLRRDAEGVAAVVRRAGAVTVSSSYLAPFTGRHC